MRLIDADELITWLSDWMFDKSPNPRMTEAERHDAEVMYETIEKAIRGIEKMPAIDAVQQWILCSERLPGEGVVVVTVDKDGDYEINAIIDEEDCEWFWEKPVAWMPLPKPYERKEE